MLANIYDIWILDWTVEVLERGLDSVLDPGIVTESELQLFRLCTIILVISLSLLFCQLHSFLTHDVPHLNNYIYNKHLMKSIHLAHANDDHFEQLVHKNAHDNHNWTFHFVPILPLFLKLLLYLEFQIIRI